MSMQAEEITHLEDDVHFQKEAWIAYGKLWSTDLPEHVTNKLYS